MDATAEVPDTPRATTPPVVVVEVPARLTTSPPRMEELARYLRTRLSPPSRVVVVHGVIGDPGCERSADGGSPPPDEPGPRAGPVNRRLVEVFTRHEIPALGLTGLDLGLLRSSPLNRARLGRLGGPPTVRAEVLQPLFAQGWVPVIAPVCLGLDGESLLVRADVVAHSVALELGAAVLEYVTLQPGLRQQGALAGNLSTATARGLLDAGRVTRTLVPRVQAAVAAVEEGIERVRIGNLETLTERTATVITGEPAVEPAG